MSFVGLETFAKRLIYGSTLLKPSFEKTSKEFESVQDFCDHAASAQFAAFAQIQRKFELVLNYITKKKIPITGVHLVGGVSCNKELRLMIDIVSKNYGFDVYTCPVDLCVDNAAMIAWNAWELKNAE